MRGASILAMAILLASVSPIASVSKGEETSETSEPPSITLTLKGVVETTSTKENVIVPGESLFSRTEREEKERKAEEERKKGEERKRDVASRESVARTGNGYTYGYCTYYVASVKQVPGNWGNAKDWLAGASQSGYKVTTEPEVGSIVVTSGSSRLGHVAIVQSISNGKIFIKEMNAVGWNKVSTRWIPVESQTIRGYIN